MTWRRASLAEHVMLLLMPLVDNGNDGDMDKSHSAYGELDDVAEGGAVAVDWEDSDIVDVDDDDVKVDDDADDEYVDYKDMDDIDIDAVGNEAARDTADTPRVETVVCWYWCAGGSRSAEVFSPPPMMMMMAQSVG